MTGWEVQEMKEAEDARIWEELNAPDPCEKQMIAASVSMIEAIRVMGRAETLLADAMAEVFDTPMEYKIGSFLDSLEDIECSLHILAEKYGKGERE